MFRNTYSRIEAVRYAEKYALSPNPSYRYFPLIGDSSGDCANFLSQCLRAGGAKMNFGNNSPWWYNNKGTLNVSDDSWSVSWTVAHSLYWRLKINEKNNFLGPKGLEVNDKNILQIGDLMFFEDDKGKIFHSAIITNIANGYPFISQHSFEALNIPYENTWYASKIHFLKIRI